MACLSFLVCLCSVSSEMLARLLMAMSSFDSVHPAVGIVPHVRRSVASLVDEAFRRMLLSLAFSLQRNTRLLSLAFESRETRRSEAKLSGGRRHAVASSLRERLLFLSFASNGPQRSEATRSRGYWQGPAFSHERHSYYMTRCRWTWVWIMRMSV